MPELRIDPRGVHLLLVDHDPNRRMALTALLTELGFDSVRACASTDDVAAGGLAPELILVDLDHPTTTVEDLQAARILNGDARTVMVGLTADGSPAGRERAIGLGVDDLLVRPVSRNELALRLQNVLSTRRLRRLLGERSARLTEALRERTAETDTVRESLSVLAAMADFHDDDTNQHAQRVGEVSAAIASRLGLPGSFVEMLRAAAPLHDIGKVGLSRRILLKPGKLTEQEWMHMQQHVEIGAQILASARSPVLVLAAEIARTHHERFDGSGYTNGLVGEMIPLSGRIVAVADVWDTLTHDRPYRPAWERERALAEMLSGAGTHFDPAVVDAFSSLENAAAVTLA